MARSNLFSIWRRREAETGRRLSYREVAEATGISPTTLVRWSTGQAGRFDATTVQALCDYFQCAVGELIVLDAESMSHSATQDMSMSSSTT
jgi:DNA-binding Xre family transcriptional regulator